MLYSLGTIKAVNRNDRFTSRTVQLVDGVDAPS
jgi:hypothetical protein